MNKRYIVIFILIGFVIGVLFSASGIIMLKKSMPLIKKVRKYIEIRKPIIIAKKPLVISDFENASDIKKWEFINANASISKNHAISGDTSLRIDYLASNAASLAKIDKFFQKNKILKNWSMYETLSFDIFNPSDKKERIILQIKDARGKRFKTKFTLDPNASNNIRIDISELSGRLRPSDIGQLNLFLWGNKDKKTFYLDNVKLLPKSVSEKTNKNISDSEFMPKPGEDLYATGDYFAFNETKWLQMDEKSNAAYIEAPLIIKNYLPSDLSNLSITGGIPFPKGQLYSLDNMTILDIQKNHIPFQSKVLSRWPDKSIKWVSVILKSGVAAKETNNYFIRYGKQIKRQPYDNIKIEEDDTAININTGIIKIDVDKRKRYLYDNIWLDKNSDGVYSDDEIISSMADLVLVHKGVAYYSHLDNNYEVSIEEKGPIKASLKATGWYVSETGKKFCKFIARLYAFKEADYVMLKHTFVYTGYPENNMHYLYKGKNLPDNETIDAIYLKFSSKMTEGDKFTFDADNKIISGNLLGTLKFLQTAHNKYSLTKDNEPLHSGNRLKGWIDLDNEENGISLGIKNFWQQFPKKLVFDNENNEIYVYLWPEDAGELDLKTTEAALGPDSVARGSAFGLAKTHDIFLIFHKGGYKEDIKNTMEGLLSDVTLIASPEWISDSRALGRLWPYDKRLRNAEDCLNSLFEWGNRQIENFGWYGMIDFGDTLTWYRKEAYDKSYDEWGWHPEGRWGWFNCETVGTYTGALIQFLRTGNYKYLIFGNNLARHIMDIDTCHYNTIANDKRLKGVIPDDYSRVGSMHRHNGNHWGDSNADATHNNVLGLIVYYYITGDERAYDVINEIGNFYLSERVAYFGHPDMAASRSVANILWGDVLLYEITGDERYRKAADKWANILYKGQKTDGSWPQNYNPIKNIWEGKIHPGFMRGYIFPALIEYHKLTGNKAIKDCIIKTTDYIIKNEKYAPYFDISAYSYWLTGEQKYKDDINEKIDFTLRHQKRNDDPLLDGMIYHKLYYARVMQYLYTMPYAFEVILNEGKPVK